MTLTVDDLIYDPVTHTTRAPDGTDVPHVTTILGVVGVATDFEEIATLSKRVADNVQAGRDRGRAVHADCHAYDDDDLIWETVDPRVLPFVEAWAECRRQMSLTPVIHGRERRLYHPVYHYTGTTDGVFMRDGSRILLDIKTGDPDDAGCQWQTAAYEGAWSVTYLDQPIDERWAVQLMPGRRVPYQITNYSALPDAWTDFGRFQAFLVTYNHQVCRRRRR